MSAPVASETRSPFKASKEISACSRGGRSCRADELGDAVGHAEAGAAGGDPVAPHDVAGHADCREVALGPRDDLAGELFVGGHPLRVGVGKAVCHDIQPGFELVVAAWPDLDPGGVIRSGAPGRARPSTFSNDVSRWPRSGQQSADRGIGKVGELDLDRSAAGVEGLFDLIQRGRARHTAKAEPGDLVERRALFGIARQALGDRDHEARRLCPATAGGLAGLGDELRLGPLGALSQGGAAETAAVGRHSPQRA